MADEKRNRRISESELDAILTEFRGTSRKDAAPKEPLAERSKRLVMKTMDDAFNAEAMEILDDLIVKEAEHPRPPEKKPRMPEPSSRSRAEPKKEATPEPGVKIWNGVPAGGRKAPATARQRNGTPPSSLPSTSTSAASASAPKRPAGEDGWKEFQAPPGRHLPPGQRKSETKDFSGLRLDQDTVDLIEAEVEDELRNPPVRRKTAKSGLAGKLNGLVRGLQDRTEAWQKRRSKESSEPEAPTEYASAGAGEGEGEEPPEGERPSGSGKLPGPFLALMALIALWREQLAQGDARPPTRERDDTLPEVDPKDAAGWYGKLMVSLKPRGLAATLLSLLALYISFAFGSPELPLAGALGGSFRAATLVLLILELSVVVCGLDIFTSGLLSIPKKRMGAETLVAVSCVFSILDAMILASMNRGWYGLPFCAVSAGSMTFAIWGAYYTCKGSRAGFRVVCSGKELHSVTGETEGADGKVRLSKTDRPPKGFVTGSEEENPGEYLFSVLAPFHLLASLLLGLLSAFARGQAAAVVHCISAISTAAAVFSCTVCYSFPFTVTARKLYRSGAAIAGWAGLRDIGRSGHLVLTDEDLFPKGNVEVGTVRVLRQESAEKVVSYTGSVAAASGGALGWAFTDLMRNNDFSLRKVSAFRAHDGGGLTAVIAGETVVMGSGRFMRLKGIRMQDKSFAQNTLYAAISGTLVGIFEIRYAAASSVRDGLKLLLRSGPTPVFSLRDFNITPTMLQETFQLPAGAMHFPGYAERFAPEPPDSEVYRRTDAVVAKDSLETLTAVTQRGRRTFYSVLICSVISGLNSVIGMLSAFFHCWAREFASPADLLTSMLVWLIPLALSVFWLEQ